MACFVVAKRLGRPAITAVVCAYGIHPQNPLVLSLSKHARGVVIALLSAVAACTPAPDPARPALWEVTAPNGAHAWLFGTIHALPRPATWRSPTLDRALAQADRLVVEVADLRNDAATARTLSELAHTPGEPPLSRRLPEALRPELARLEGRAGLTDSATTDLETWAAALVLARATERDSGSDTGLGVDRALLSEAGKPVVELEGARRQLGRFDSLPETAQRALLAAVVRDAGHEKADAARLAAAWRNGDVEAIAHETDRGILADPTLREALYTARNREWTGAIAAMLAAREQPFVAVGAAHMAGPEGLPALLAARGYKVVRVQ
ncbi:MAG: TraB/GumN family protein [Novosphingobium sp.]|nr:TraB/GumN family protein [Novosphingobium sp.]